VTPRPDAIVPVGGSGAMFDRIAPRYDLLNRMMSFGIDRRWRRKTVAALELEPEHHVLDLATGTADLAIAVARGCAGVHVIGIDPSGGMLAVGERKLERSKVGDRVELHVGDAQDLDFPDDRFDGVCIAFGIRNVDDRALALREMARVTRRGGRVAILELSEPRGKLLGALARFHVHTVVPRLGALLSGAREYRYLQQSIEEFPAREQFAELMQDNGLDVLDIKPLGFGACCLFVATPQADAPEVAGAAQ